MQATIDAFIQSRASRAGKPPPTLATLREHFAPGGKLFPIPADVKQTDVDAAGVPAHWLSAPGAREDRVVLFLHGGGYTLGSLKSHGELAARIGRAAGARVLFLDYRLTPEHPFPAAVDDTKAGWTWLTTKAGIAPSAVAVVGDSAGGGLTLALMLALRDAREALPASAAVMSPAIDLTLSGSSVVDRAKQDVIFTAPMIQKIYADYLAGADPRNPAASPLFAPLHGLPPLLVQVGSAELLFSDSERLAKAATQAGVEVTLQVGEGLPHVYQSAGDAPEAIAATEAIGRFMRAHWH